MKKRLIISLSVIITLYLAFWLVCANLFKTALIDHLNHNNIKYESLAMKWYPFHIGAAISKPHWEDNKVLIEANETMIIKSDLLAKNYIVASPSEWRFYFDKSNNNHYYSFKSQDLIFHVGFAWRSKLIIKYFKQFDLSASDAFSLLKDISIRSEQYEILDPKNQLIFKDLGITYSIHFTKSKLPDVKAKILSESKGATFGSGLLTVLKNLHLEERQVNSIYNTLEFYQNLSGKTSLIIDMHFVDIDNFKFQFDIDSKIKSEGIFSDFAKGSIGASLAKGKQFTLFSNLTYQQKLTQKWYDISINNISKERADIQAQTKNGILGSVTADDLKSIMPKLHEFEFINYFLNFDMKSSSIKEFKDIEANIYKIGFETNTYSLLIQEGKLSNVAAAQQYNFTISIDTYEKFIQDLATYIKKLLIISSKSPKDQNMLRDINNLDFNKLAKTLLLDVATEKDDKNLKIKVRYDNATNKVYIGKKEMAEVIQALMLSLAPLEKLPPPENNNKEDLPSSP